MFESIMNFFKKLGKTENKETKSKETAKERLHLVLMQDRANVSADFLEMMKQEIIEVIKKYIEVDEKEIDVRLTNDVKADGTTGAPSLYANIPIVNIKNEMKKEIQEEKINEEKKEIKETLNKEQNKNEEKSKVEEGKDGNKNEKQKDKEIEEKEDLKDNTKNEEKINEEKVETKDKKNETQQKEKADKKENKNEDENKSGE